MSTSTTSEILKDWVIPNLNRSNYANQLDEAFENIKDNYSILSNRDFVKGDRGNSLSITTIDLNSSNPTQRELVEGLKSKIRSAVTAGYTSDQLADVESYKWDDFFNNNPGELHLITEEYEENGLTRERYISSLYYTFLDGRFNHTNVGNIDEELFDKTIDTSCVLVYDISLNDGNGGFNTLRNAFPTIYYEIGVGLCWKLNGIQTGIPVKGPRGTDGKHSDIPIVRVNNDLDQQGEGVVTEIWTKENGWGIIDDINEYDGYSCFVLAPIVSYDEDGELEIEGAKGSQFYLGKLYSVVDSGDEKSLHVICKPETSLNSEITNESFINSMKNISLIGDNKSVTTPKGIFVPLKPLYEIVTGDNDKQSSHLLAATSINNESNLSSDLRTDLMLVPVDDTNITINIDSKNPTNTTNIKVDKHLYVKIGDLTEINNYIKKSFTNDSNISLDSILIYKLVNVSTKGNPTDISTYYTKNPDIRQLLNKTPDKVKDLSFRFLDGSIDIPTTEIADDGTEGINVESNRMEFISRRSDELFKTFDNVQDLLPEHFLHKNLYCWELHKIENATVDSNDVIPFKYIYTDTITPGLTTRLLTFNTISTIDVCKDTTDNNTIVFKSVWESYAKYIDAPEPNDYKAEFTDPDTHETELRDVLDEHGYNYDEACVIWEAESPYKEDLEKIYIGKGYDTILFKFERFIPIFNNSYRLHDDTSFNINYNVNITGDDENSTKNLSVNGDINCENINVYSLSSSGELYTKENITTDGGLFVGKNNDSTFNSKIDRDGSISCSSISCSGDLTASNITSKGLNNISSIDIVSSQNVNISAQEIGLGNKYSQFVLTDTKNSIKNFDKKPDDIIGTINESYYGGLSGDSKFPVIGKSPTETLKIIRDKATNNANGSTSVILPGTTFNNIRNKYFGWPATLSGNTPTASVREFSSFYNITANNPFGSGTTLSGIGFLGRYCMYSIEIKGSDFVKYDETGEKYVVMNGVDINKIPALGNLNKVQYTPSMKIVYNKTFHGLLYHYGKVYENNEYKKIKFFTPIYYQLFYKVGSAVYPYKNRIYMRNYRTHTASLGPGEDMVGSKVSDYSVAKSRFSCIGSYVDYEYLPDDLVNDIFECFNLKGINKRDDFSIFITVTPSLQISTSPNNYNTDGYFQFIGMFTEHNMLKSSDYYDDYEYVITGYAKRNYGTYGEYYGGNAGLYYMKDDYDSHDIISFLDDDVDWAWGTAEGYINLRPIPGYAVSTNPITYKVLNDMAIFAPYVSGGSATVATQGNLNTLNYINRYNALSGGNVDRSDSIELGYKTTEYTMISGQASTSIGTYGMIAGYGPTVGGIGLIQEGTAYTPSLMYSYQEGNRQLTKHVSIDALISANPTALTYGV